MSWKQRLTQLKQLLGLTSWHERLELLDLTPDEKARAYSIVRKLPAAEREEAIPQNLSYVDVVRRMLEDAKSHDASLLPYEPPAVPSLRPAPGPPNVAWHERLELLDLTPDEKSRAYSLVRKLPAEEREEAIPQNLSYVDAVKRMLEDAKSRDASLLPYEPPAGPPNVSWLDRAGSAEQQADGNWMIKMPDGRCLPYVDPDGKVPVLRDWLPAQQEQKRYVPEAFNQPPVVPIDPVLRPPVTAIITGLTKTGKSYTQSNLLPAMVADALRTGRLKGPPPVLLPLDGADLEMRFGAKARLLSLLRMVLTWAVECNVPVKRLAWQAAVDAVEGRCPQTVDFIGSAVKNLFYGLRAPVLVMFDEVQNLVLREAVRDVPQVDYALHIRDNVVKGLLVYGPRNVAWNITGSCMVMVWMQIANMPPNGYTLMLGNRSIRLPATYPADSMRIVWDHLVKENPALPLELFKYAEPTPAMLVMLARDWLAEGEAPDVAAFAGHFARRKLRNEALQGWRAAFETMPVALRKAVYDLSSVVCGCDAAILQSDDGLFKSLDANLHKNASGRYYLKSATQRQLVQMILDDQGDFISAVDTQHVGSLLQLEARELFRQLGEAVWNFGMLQPAKPAQSGKLAKSAKAPAAFLEAFEGLASQLDSRVSHTQWPTQGWFAMAESSSYCSEAAAQFHSFQGNSVLTPSLVLAFYFRFVCHIVTHNLPWDQHKQPVMMPGDILLFSGFADVLGVGVEELVQRMQDMLALLQPSMVSDSMEASMPGGDSATGGSTLSAAASSRPCCSLSSPAVGSFAAVLLRHDRRLSGVGMDGMRLVVGQRGSGAPGARALGRTGAAHRPVLARPPAAAPAFKSAAGALRQAGGRIS